MGESTDDIDHSIEYAIKNGLDMSKIQRVVDFSRANSTDLIEWSFQNGVSLDTLRHDGIDLSKADSGILAQYDRDHHLSLDNLNGLNPPNPDAGAYEKLTNKDVTKFDNDGSLGNIVGAATNPATVVIEDFDSVTYYDMHMTLYAATNVDGGHSAAWKAIASNIVDALNDFQQGLATQEAAKEWQGKTHDAAIANLQQSLAEPTTQAAGASALGTLIDYFSQTVFQTRWYIESNFDSYYHSIMTWPQYLDQINQAYNSYAQTVMSTVYAPNIAAIAEKNPGFTAAAPSSTGGIPPPPPPVDGPPPGPPPVDGPPPGPPPVDGPPPGPPPVDGPPPGLPPVDGPPPVDGGAGDLSNGPGGPGIASDIGNLPNGSDGLNSLPALPALAGLGSSLPGLNNLAAGAGGSADGSGDPLSGLSGPTLPDGAGGADSLAGLGSSLPGLNNLAAGAGGSADGSGDPLSGLSGPTLPGGAGGADPLTGAGLGGGGAGNGLQSLQQALQPLQSATQPLQQALSAAQKPPGSTPGGLPNAGQPHGLDPLHKANSPAGQAGAGGGGSGIGSKGLNTFSPPGAPVAGSTKGADYPGTPATQVSNLPGAGGSSAGAPSGGGGGGGQRGQSSKEHKQNKVLRRKKNGEIVIGEADAVVPVIGVDDESENPPPVQRTPQPRVPQTLWPPQAVNSSPRRGAEQVTEQYP